MKTAMETAMTTPMEASPPNASYTIGALLEQHQKLDPTAETTTTDFTWKSKRVWFCLPEGTRFLLHGIPHVLGSMPNFHTEAIQVLDQSDESVGISIKVFLKNGSDFTINAGQTVYNMITGLESVLANNTIVTLDGTTPRDLHYQWELMWGSFAAVMICIVLLIFGLDNQPHTLATLITCGIQCGCYAIQQNFLTGLHAGTLRSINTVNAVLIMIQGGIWVVGAWWFNVVPAIGFIYFVFGGFLVQTGVIELNN